MKYPRIRWEIGWGVRGRDVTQPAPTTFYLYRLLDRYLKTTWTVFHLLGYLLHASSVLTFSSSSYLWSKVSCCRCSPASRSVPSTTTDPPAPFRLTTPFASLPSTSLTRRWSRFRKSSLLVSSLKLSLFYVLFPRFSRFTSPSGSGLWSWRLWPAPTSSTSWVGYYLHLYVSSTYRQQIRELCPGLLFMANFSLPSRKL